MRATSPASTSATIVSATTPAAGTAVTSVRSLNETVSSLVAVSTVRSTGRFSVASGFIATRATSRPPVVMPPSVPPARVEPRTYSPASASHRISSWASLPRRPATSKPSPISTPFIAWMLMSACARRPSILRSQCTCEPEAGRHAVAEHLDDAAERVADLGRGLDLGDHRRLGGGVEAAHRRLVDRVEVGRGRAGGRASARAAAHLDHVAEHLGAELGEQQLGQRAGGDAGRGLAGAGALEHVAGVVEAVLLHADEVGVAGPGLAERLLGGARRGRHLLLPLRPLGVVDHDRDRRPEGATVAHAAEELDVVALEAHAGAAAEPEAAAGELVADLLDGDGQARGQALDHHRERGAVGLTGGQVAQHPDDLRGDDSRIPAHPFAAPGSFARAAPGPQPPRYQSMIGVADEDGGERAGGQERAERHAAASGRGSAGAISTIPITAP